MEKKKNVENNTEKNKSTKEEVAVKTSKNINSQLNDENNSTLENAEVLTSEIGDNMEIYKKMDELEKQFSEIQDKYYRLAAEYDNYRKRTTMEKSDLIQHAGEKFIKDLLPVMDDLEIAITHIENTNDVSSLKSGIFLIMEKFHSFLKQQGVNSLDVIDKPFDDSTQQAVAIVPIDDPQKKGMVIDCVKKGYKLHDKIIRYADVVVGQ